MFVALNILEKQMQYSKANDVYNLKYLAVNGNDIMEVGLEGEEVGVILNSLLDMVMKEEVKNNKEDLLAAISKIE
jgi:tRNA nucleotidyltransferase (CCA-adding enzyme)